MKGQLGPRKVNKLVVSRNPENTQCCKKMRNTVDSSDSFVPFSPDTMKSAALEYLAREKKRVAIDKTPASFNFYGNLRHEISEKQQIFENRNVQFKEVPWSFSFENEDMKPSQPVIVDGTDITADILEHTRISYFDLCRTQSTLLHIGLTEGIHLQHAVFIICETVAIATAIKSCDISTPQKDILYWGKALDSYSSLGMDVGFLRSRVSRLLEIKTNAAKTMDRKKDIEAKTEKERNEDKIDRFELDIEEMIKKIGELEMEIENMREQNRKFDDERESIRKRVEEFETMFRIEASSPCYKNMRGVVDKSSKVMGRAKEIQENLSMEHPSFIRAMRRSHVTVTFYMCPPTEFCRKYLPKDKEIFVLEVESGKSYDIKYLGSNCAFSAGWRQFAIAENLVENDVLVFHLIKPCKFKVYIVRGRELANVDRASTSDEIDDCAAEREVEKNEACVRDKKRRRPVQINSPREKLELNGLSKKSSIHTNNRKSSETIPDFKNFKIAVDGTSIELPHQVREDYYKLCCSQKSYLHCHLINGIDRELAASVISGTVNISNAITESKISTPQDKIMYWNKTLDGFEVFGMNVGFIRARLNRLSGLTYYFDRYKEAKAESKRVKEKIVDLKKEKRRLNVKSEVLKKVVDKRKAAYEEEANAPW